jgi:hypothetical protein
MLGELLYPRNIFAATLIHTANQSGGTHITNYMVKVLKYGSDPGSVCREMVVPYGNKFLLYRQRKRSNATNEEGGSGSGGERP